jgi:hypothetical protein
MTDDLPDRLDQAAADHVKWPDSTPDDQTIDDLRAAAAELRALRHLAFTIGDVDRLRGWAGVILNEMPGSSLPDYLHAIADAFARLEDR